MKRRAVSTVILLIFTMLLSVTAYALNGAGFEGEYADKGHERRRFRHEESEGDTGSFSDPFQNRRRFTDFYDAKPPGEENEDEYGEDELYSYFDLDYWKEDSAAAESISEYVDEVTDEMSDGYIPPEDRIAVFNLDGVLYADKLPIRFDTCLFVYRVLYDREYEASGAMRDLALEFREEMRNREISQDLLETVRESLPEVFDGMTAEEYRNYVRSFKDMSAGGFENMSYGEAFYLPMLSLVEYLLDNDFEIYLSTETDRNAARVLMEGYLSEGLIPDDHIIGSDWTIREEEAEEEDPEAEGAEDAEGSEEAEGTEEAEGSEGTEGSKETEASEEAEGTEEAQGSEEAEGPKEAEGTEEAQDSKEADKEDSKDTDLKKDKDGDKQADSKSEEEKDRDKEGAAEKESEEDREKSEDRESKEKPEKKGEDSDSEKAAEEKEKEDSKDRDSKKAPEIEKSEEPDKKESKESNSTGAEDKEYDTPGRKDPKKSEKTPDYGNKELKGKMMSVDWDLEDTDLYEEFLKYMKGEFVFDGEYFFENSGENKIYSALREIGKKPVLFFGSGADDLPMAQFVNSNREYRGMSCLLLIDDNERDYGDPDGCEALERYCDKAEIDIISERDDFLQVFMEGAVKRRPVRGGRPGAKYQALQTRCL